MIGDKEDLIIKLGDYQFMQTCKCSPEQYDVLNQDDAIIGYVRLRWGNLRVFCPDQSGKQIFLHAFNSEWKGSFANESERDFYFNKVVDALNHYFESATEKDF